jgi:hypothetical protein
MLVSMSLPQDQGNWLVSLLSNASNSGVTLRNVSYVSNAALVLSSLAPRPDARSTAAAPQFSLFTARHLQPARPSGAPDPTSPSATRSQLVPRCQGVVRCQLVPRGSVPCPPPPCLPAPPQPQVAAGIDSTAEFSSAGPTSDGRVKPDLVAPGDAITSAEAFQGIRTGRAG